MNNIMSIVLFDPYMYYLCTHEWYAFKLTVKWNRWEKIEIQNRAEPSVAWRFWVNLRSILCVNALTGSMSVVSYNICWLFFWSMKSDDHSCPLLKAFNHDHRVNTNPFLFKIWKKSMRRNSTVEKIFLIFVFSAEFDVQFQSRSLEWERKCTKIVYVLNTSRFLRPSAVADRFSTTARSEELHTSIHIFFFVVAKFVYNINFES